MAMIHELPVLDILEAILDEHKLFIQRHRREQIVLTFGQALKEAIKMRKMESNDEHTITIPNGTDDE